MSNTTDTCANTEQKEKRQAIQLPAALEVWDYYAAAALPAVISGLLGGHTLTTNGGEPITEEHIAEQTAEFVDAMLAERAKRMEAES